MDDATRAARTGHYCRIEGCGRPHRARGMCGMHYERWRKYGDIDADQRSLPLDVRLWAKIDKKGPVPECRPDLGPCWLWTGARGGSKGGYGHLAAGVGPPYTMVYSHRAAYELLVGPIPNGKQLDHLCRVTLCCNPTHLEPVTSQENVARAGVFRRKLICLRGHVKKAGKNRSWCPECHRLKREQAAA